MTPAARVQAAIELLDEIIAAARDGGAAADTLIVRYFKARRYAGSKDRRFVTDLVYRAIRRSGERPASGRAAMLGLADDDSALDELFDGSPYGAAPRGEGEEGTPLTVLPGWIRGHLAPLIDEGEQMALLQRAPLDIRVNRLKADPDAVRAEFPEAVAVDGVPYALRLPDGTKVEQSAAYAAGFAEVQDAGSQVIAQICQTRPGMTVIDLCAGAGGKTLALAAAMGGEGRIVAADTSRARLSRLPDRARRAGAGNIETLLLDIRREAESLSPFSGQADVVLIDAPCSGTGTWRRNPEARWRLTPERLDRLVAEQARILDLAVPLVKRGGRLVYAVCALTDAEGRAQVDAFLARHPDWQAEPISTQIGREWGQGRLLSPAHDGTDGFFIAALVQG
ncbi:RsmB/NOP family class I SAM-dependent RNA methyltransferase [Sphingobium subterraneum]|uniref:16S rRNA (Cytosine967-C5)-methyltransferase n=1 Tax=Sphingobium subterraneum TaxID=627688 RepID=A0A841IZ29_9SPHN|nr:RsmB/NOP family class I SAM-dependent RNA methyltransferase [Sphingobium subterraneum]MBB6122536.1 16S rRNA (cytosine967-C5)-methyltransferase [Sphingobium subterraneum]